METGRHGRAGVRGQGGFTLLEVLVSVALLVAVTSMVFLSFNTVTRAWQNGITLTDDLHHGDFVMDQLAQALRSAYYPDVRSADRTGYGFWLFDEGSGADAHDRISWVKLGGAIVGTNSPIADALHRIMFSVETNPKTEESAAAFRIWRMYGGADGLEFGEQPPEFLSSRIVGFNCRIATNRTDDGWEWEDEWEDENTNQLPRAVELTLYLKPLSKGEDPVELKRYVEIPVAHLSW